MGAVAWSSCVPARPLTRSPDHGETTEDVSSSTAEVEFPRLPTSSAAATTEERQKEPPGAPADVDRLARLTSAL